MEVAAADIMVAAVAVDGTTDGGVTADTDTIVDMDTMDIMMAMVNLTPHQRRVRGNLVIEVPVAAKVPVVEVLAAEEVQEALPAEVLAAEEVQEALPVAVLAVAAVAVLAVAAVAVLAVAAEDVVESSTNVYLDVYRRWNLICIGSH